MLFKLFVVFGIILTLIYAAPSASKGSGSSHARGEHVINKGVLSVYPDIIKRFLQTHVKDHTFDEIIKLLGTSGTLSHIYKDYHHPIQNNNIATSIESGMSVHFTEAEKYNDENAVPFGRAIEKLRQSAVSYMKELYDTRYGNIDTKKTKSKKAVEDVINDINSKELYIDKAARDKYLKDAKKLKQKEKKEKEDTYTEARNTAHSMFASLPDKLILWVKEIKNAVGKQRGADHKANPPPKKPARKKKH